MLIELENCNTYHDTHLNEMIVVQGQLVDHRPAISRLLTGYKPAYSRLVAAYICC